MSTPTEDAVRYGCMAILLALVVVLAGALLRVGRAVMS